MDKDKRQKTLFQDPLIRKVSKINSNLNEYSGSKFISKKDFSLYGSFSFNKYSFSQEEYLFLLKNIIEFQKKMIVKSRADRIKFLRLILKEIKFKLSSENYKQIIKDSLIILNT